MRLHLRPPRRITSIWRTARPPQTPIRGAVLREPWQIGVLMLAVVMLTIQAFVINRAAGIDDPFWDPMQRPATPAGRT